MNSPVLHPKSAEFIFPFIQDELIVTVNEIRKFVVEAVDLEERPLLGVRRSEVNGKLRQYRLFMKRMLELDRRWSDPDVFFETIDKKTSKDREQMGLILTDWHNYNASVEVYLKDGFNLLNEVDKILTNMNTSSFARISLFLGLLAFASSIVAIWISTGATDILSIGEYGITKEVFMEAQVNLVGVLLATLSSMVVGSVWYAKPVFGKTWMKLVGLTDEKMKENSFLPMVFTILRSAFLAYLLAYLAFVANAFYGNSFTQDSLKLGLMVSLIVVPTMVMHDLFEGRRKKISLINGVHEFVTIMVMALVIGLVGV